MLFEVSVFAGASQGTFIESLKYLALVAMDQDRVLRLVLEDLDDLRNIVERVDAPRLLVCENMNSDVLDAVRQNELKVLGCIWFIDQRSA